MANPFKTLAARVGRALMRWTGSGSGLRGGYRYYLPGTKLDFEALAGDPWMHSSVAACLAWVRRNVGEPPPRVVRPEPGGGDVAVEGHPAAPLLDRPNPAYDWPTTLQALALSLLVDGNAYLRIIRDNLGGPAELWYVPHFSIAPTWPLDGSAFLSGYEYWVDAGRFPLAVEDVIHFRDGLDPRNERLGLSSLKAMLREVVGDTALITMMAALARNFGVPSFMLTPDGEGVEFGDATVKQIKEYFLAKTTGDEAGKPLALSDPVKATRLGFSPEELSAEKLHRVPESRICAALGVPSQVVNLISGDATKTFANYGEARLAAYDDCLEPLWATIARALTHQLLGREYGRPAGERVDFDRSRIKALAPNQSLILKDAIAAVAGGLLTPNEGRARIGEPKLPDGDVLLVPGSLTTLEALAEPPAPIPPALAPFATNGKAPRFGQADEGDDGEPGTNGTAKAWELWR